MRVIAAIAALGFLLGSAALSSASADTVSLQCDMPPGQDLGNFSGESVFVLLDLDGHTAASSYGDAHRDERTSPLTVGSDRLTWTYSVITGNYSWIVDYALDRSTLRLLASARGVNIGGITNTGNVVYACSKLQKQI